MQVGRRQTFTHLVLIIVVRLLSTIIQRSAEQPACADTRAELFSSKGEETTDDADWEEGGRCCQSEEQSAPAGRSHVTSAGEGAGVGGGGAAVVEQQPHGSPPPHSSSPPPPPWDLPKSSPSPSQLSWQLLSRLIVAVVWRCQAPAPSVSVR